MASQNNKARSQQTQARSGAFSRAGWVLLMLLFLAAIILDAFFSESGVLKIWQLEREYIKLSQEVGEIRQQNDDLEFRIEELRNDPEAVEKVAREELGYVKPGEVVYIFP
jgi:cell division protein FtsB